MKKTVTLSFLKKIDWRGRKVVLAGGCFDILHIGHIDHLRKAKSKGDVLVVHITGDRRMLEKKNRKPVFSAKERAEIIAALECVDYVFTYDGRHYDRKVIESIRPSVLFFNSEAFSEDVKRYLEENFLSGKVKVLVSRLPKKNSSSSVIGKIREGDGDCGSD